MHAVVRVFLTLPKKSITYAGLIYCKNFESFCPFVGEKRQVEFKISFINSEISRNFYFCKLFSNNNDRIEKNY